MDDNILNVFPRFGEKRNAGARKSTFIRRDYTCIRIRDYVAALRANYVMHSSTTSSHGVEKEFKLIKTHHSRRPVAQRDRMNFAE